MKKRSEIMQISNPFQMNDWEIKKFLRFVLAIQLAMLGTMGMHAMGLEIPIVRPLVTFLYLTIIPGIIMLRILKLHKLGNIETLLYTAGLSIVTLMFGGLFMNIVYPFLGISGPISTMPLIITISAIILILCVLCYIRDKDFYDSSSVIDLKNIFNPPALFLCLVVFLPIFGTYQVNTYHNSNILKLLLVIIAIIVLLIGFEKFIPKNLYPLAVLVIGFSLLFHNSLISMYIWGWDIYGEFYFTNLVKMSSVWDTALPENLNAMLSLVLLGSIYSIIADLSITWVFKIIYPILFSLVPLGLYLVFQKQTDDRVAFLSCFFFMSGYTFYVEMLSLARQQIAELLLVLLIMLMIDKNMYKIKRSFLFVAFGVSLAVSHYGLAYIYMSFLTIAWLILILVENPMIIKLMDNFDSKFGGKKEKLDKIPNSLKMTDRTINSTFVLFFIIFALAWYIYVSDSSVFNRAVNIGDRIASSIFAEFLNPTHAEGMKLMTAQYSTALLHKINKGINYLNQFFIVIGCFILLLKHREMKFEREYVPFCVLSLGLVLAGIAVPYFASSLNITRLYQISLFFLAPLCVIGGINVFKLLMSKNMSCAWKVLHAYFVFFLLLSSGWMYEVASDNNPGSFSLSNYAFRWFFTYEQDIAGAQWLHNTHNFAMVYSDLPGLQMLPNYGNIPAEQLKNITAWTSIEENAYLYLRYGDVIYIGSDYYKNFKYSYFSTKFSPYMSKIYDSNCIIYYTDKSLGWFVRDLGAASRYVP